MSDVKKLARIVLERVTGAKPAKLPPMFKREQAVVSQKLKDIAAQEKVARAKEARATAKWEKMSEAEKDKAMKERLFTPEQKERLPELEKRRAEEPKRELAPEDKAALRRELTMSPTDKLNQAAIDMKKERAARIAAAAEGGAADDDATKVLTTTQTMPMAKGAGSKALNALSIPQKILMRKTAEAMGIDLGPEGADAAVDSDKASEAIVEKTAEKLGIPESSALGAVGKAAAKTVLDYGYDPLGPIGKIAKAAKGTKALGKVLSKLKK